MADKRKYRVVEVCRGDESWYRVEIIDPGCTEWRGFNTYEDKNKAIAVAQRLSTKVITTTIWESE